MAQYRGVRSLYLVVSIIQLIAIFERQVFDFMGYMWLSIGLNFLHVICVILGIFGVLQYRCGYIVLAVVWNLLWIGWNAFVVCLHLDVGELRKDMHILNLGTRTSNWWLANGPGCMPTYNFSAIDPISFKPQIVRVEQCLLDYQYVEVAHSSIQILLSIFALVSGVFLAVYYRGKDATCFEDQNSHPLPNYSLTLKPSSTDHSTPDELYGIPAKPPVLSNFRNSTYETTSRSIKPNDHPYTGTIPSAHSNGYTNGVISTNPLRNNPLQAGSTRRTSVRPSSIYNNSSSNASNDPIYRVTRNGQNVNGLLNGVDNVRAYKHLQAPPVKDGGVGSKVNSLLNAGMHAGANVNTSQSVEQTYGQNNGKRQPSPNIPRAPVYIPGSVSPYHSRAGTEVSF